MGLTIDLAECALPFIGDIKNCNIVPIATRSDYLPLSVELLSLDKRTARGVTKKGVRGRMRRCYGSILGRGSSLIDTVNKGLVQALGVRSLGVTGRVLIVREGWKKV